MDPKRCRACQEQVSVPAATFCKDCRDFRARWMARYAPSRLVHEDYRCDDCHVRLFFCEGVGRRFCQDCRARRDQLTYERWRDARSDCETPIPEKKCTKCDEVKSRDEFASRRNHWTGLASICRECTKESDRKRNAAPSTDASAAARLFMVERRADQRRDELIQAKPWCAPDLTPYERRVSRREHDAEYDLRVRLQERLQSQLALRNRGKSSWAAKSIRKAVRNRGGVARFLGYTADELREHLQSLFVDGMSWEALKDGRIHIDHIMPVSRFDLTNEDDVRRAWSLSNLQPLWAKDNIRKGALLPDEWRAVA